MATTGTAVLALLVAATSSGQATPAPDAESEIPPVVWELVEISSVSSPSVAVAEPERYTVQFQPHGQVVISADCHEAAGIFAVEDEALDIELTGSTLASCSPDSRTEPFLALLESASMYEINPDGFFILSGDDGRLRLRPALAGVQWEWQESTGGGDSLVRPEDPHEYTLTFQSDGALAIGADCRRAMGRYAVDGPTLDLSVGSVSPVTCPPGSLKDRYLRDLDDVASYVIREGNLYLALWADGGILEFAARYVASAEATPEAG